MSPVPASNEYLRIGDEYQTAGKQGVIRLPLGSWRLIATNEIPAIAVASGNGGNLASDSAPKLIRTSTSTDKQLTINWASSSSVEITQGFEYPLDLDDSYPLVFHFLAKMGGSTDTPVVAVGFFEGTGDTNAGGNSAALSTALIDRPVVIAASNVGAYPNAAAVSLTPGAHTTDALIMTATWMTYTRLRS